MDNFGYNWRGVIFLSIKIVIALLLATFLFATALVTFLNRIENRSVITLLPSYILPQTTSFDSYELKVNGTKITKDEEVKFICAHFQGQRKSHHIIDGGGAILQQERVATLFFGTTSMNRILVRKQKLLGSLLFDEELDAAPLLYTRIYEAVGFVFLKIWFENYQNLLRSPFWTAVVLFPMLLIFSSSVSLTRFVVDMEKFNARILMETTSIFFVYIFLIVVFQLDFATTVQTIDVSIMADEAASINHSNIKRQSNDKSLEIVFAFVVCACSIRIWRGSISGIVSRIGVFITTITVSHILLNLILGVSLILSGTGNVLEHFVNIRSYSSAAYEANVDISMSKDLSDFDSSVLQKLPSWSEACPPWKRYDLHSSLP